MKPHRLILIAAIGLAPFHTLAQTSNSHGLCAADEEPVFSCELQGKARKRVSLCAARADDLQNGWRFRYLFGRPGKVELMHPASGNGGDAFTFTHQAFTGATGGGTYGFTNGGYKYILYSVSGTGIDYAGLQLQRADSTHAIVNEMHCKQSTFRHTTNRDVSNAVRQWKEDPDLISFGSRS